MEPPTPLLLWREASIFSARDSPEDDQRPGPDIPRRRRTCPWCGTATVYQEYESREAEYDFTVQEEADCPLCGWWIEYELVVEGESCTTYSPSTEQVEVGVLKEFDYDDASVPEDELHGFLARNPRALSSLTPRRFEKLVTQVFSDHGWSASLTAATRDGGADILLTDEKASELTIVECKHTARGATIGVQVVRSLMGAAIDWQTRSVKLVTNGKFSQEARSYADRCIARGYTVSLEQASELLVAQGVYDSRHLPLSELDDESLSVIIEENRQLALAAAPQSLRRRRRQAPGAAGRSTKSR